MPLWGEQSSGGWPCSPQPLFMSPVSHRSVDQVHAQYIMMPPTIAQQRGLAYAPMPFGAVSFLSSAYVIYHIVYQQPQKRKRLYHRLVLAMNVALLPFSFTSVWSTLAVPEGTPHYAGAVGTVDTCTAQGFIRMLFVIAIPIYYNSLVMQAYLGIKNNFNEEKYRWIETPIHIVAYAFPLSFSTVLAATENFNPNGSNCWYAQSPRGCMSDPAIPCERGMDIEYFIYAFGFTQVFLYLIYPPSVIYAMSCWIKKLTEEVEDERNGMSILRESVRKQMMQSIYLQLSLYLISFWSTWVFGLINTIHQLLSGEISYKFLIFSNCVFALQGFIYMLVYFNLPWMGWANPDAPRTVFSRHSSQQGLQLTVSETRENGDGPIEQPTDHTSESFKFNIFDGIPDEDSPWSRFIVGGRIDEQALEDFLET